METPKLPANEVKSGRCRRAAVVNPPLPHETVNILSPFARTLVLLSLYDPSKKRIPAMQASYTLNTKIEALNLLDLHDGDFQLVRSLLEIPLKTLRGWRADQDKLRRRFEDRQYRHFANIKLELLKDMFETSRDIMKKIKSGDHEGSTASQLVYALNTLLNQANQLEESFEDLPPNPQNEAEQPNRIGYAYDDNPQHDPPNAVEDPQQPRPPQSVGVRAALEQFGIGTNQHPESPPPGALTLLMDRPHLQTREAKVARSGNKRKSPKKRRRRAKRKAH